VTNVRTLVFNAGLLARSQFSFIFLGPRANADLVPKFHVAQLTLRKEHGLRVNENRVPRRILRPMRNEGAGGWRKLHNKVFLYLYSSPSIIRIMKSRRMRWAGHVARMGEKRHAYRLVVGKPEGRTPLGRPRHRWVDNI
jgi:hypothetical protein